VKQIGPRILGILALCALLIAPGNLAAVNAVNNVVRLPPGTFLDVRMIDSISTDRNVTGQVFRGSLAHSIQVGNRIVLPRGANVWVRLVDASSAGRVSGRSRLALQLDKIQYGNHIYPVRSDVVSFRGKSESKSTAKRSGIGAAIGGGIGALFGGGKGAAIGAGAGAGTGFATQALKEPEQIVVPSEMLVRFRLAAPLHVG